MTGITQAADSTLRARSVRHAGMRVADALPDALQDGWARTTWGGVHGSHPLTAQVGSTELAIHVRSGADVAAIAMIGGSITDPAGVRAGSFSRAVRLDDDELRVVHTSLSLADAYQGAGFATGFNAQAEARYLAAGITGIDLTASSSTGGYAWARRGFEMAVLGATEAERAVARATGIRRLVEQARDAGDLSTHDIRRLTPQLIGSDGVVGPRTLTSVQELAALDGGLGRRVLLGRTWQGTRELSPAGAPAGVTAALDAPRRLARRLPEGLRPDGITELIASRSHGELRAVGAETTIRRFDAERLTEVETFLRIGRASEPEPFVSARIAADGQGTMRVVESFTEDASSLGHRARARLDDAWTSAGIIARQDASSTAQRSLV